MKKIVIGLAVLGATAIVGRAQLFNANLSGAQEVPPNSSFATGSGSLSLTGDFLSFSVTTIFPGGTTPTDGALFGPANPGQVGSLVFDLGTPTVNSVGGYVFASWNGSQTLTPQEANDLTAGLDYLNIATATMPGGEIRGQVSTIPEPSTALLTGLGAWVVRRGWRRKA